MDNAQKARLRVRRRMLKACDLPDDPFAGTKLDGTGKTELARLLAAQLGAPLFVAGRQDDAGSAVCPWPSR